MSKAEPCPKWHAVKCDGCGKVWPGPSEYGRPLVGVCPDCAWVCVFERGGQRRATEDDLAILPPSYRALLADLMRAAPFDPTEARAAIRILNRSVYREAIAILQPGDLGGEA